jgi:hypothetical protein
VVAMVAILSGSPGQMVPKAAPEGGGPEHSQSGGEGPEHVTKHYD